MYLTLNKLLTYLLTSWGLEFLRLGVCFLCLGVRNPNVWGLISYVWGLVFLYLGVRSSYVWK